MRVRQWATSLILTLVLLLGTVVVAQAANDIVIVKSEYTQKYYTKIGGSFSAYWSSVETIMRRNGFEDKYDVITDADVEDGRLSADTWKLAILPVNNAMSKKEAEEILKYVKAGGALIANYNVGMRFENGNDAVNFLLADATGVDRAPEFASGVNPNYSRIKVVDQYHPFFGGLPQSIQFLKQYTVIGMPREGVNVVARWNNDAGVPSNVDRKSGALFQIGRVTYNGGDIWDPDKSMDTPELNLLIKNMITELLSDKIPVALAPPRKLDDGFYVKGRYALRTVVEDQKVVQAEGSPHSSTFVSADQDGYRNSTVMLAPRYVNGKVEAGAELWSRIHVDRPQLAESTFGYATTPITPTIPTIMSAWAKINTKDVLVTAATRPDGGFEPIGDLRMVASSDPLGLVSSNVVNNPTYVSNWTSNIKAHIKNFKGWTGLVGLGATQGGWPGLSGYAWAPWTYNEMLYLREDFLKFGKSRLEAGLTYNQRRLDAWGNNVDWRAWTEVLSPDLKLKTPYGNVVLQVANSYQNWGASPANVLGTAFKNDGGRASLVAIERVPVGNLRVSTEFRSVSDDFRNYSYVGMQDYDLWKAHWEGKYDTTAMSADPTNKRAYYDQYNLFADQTKAEEAISTWLKYQGNQVQKTTVAGDLIKRVVGLDVTNESIKSVDDESQVYAATKVEVSARKPLGIFTPKLTVDKKEGREWRWAATSEQLSWQKSGQATTYVIDNHAREFPVDNLITKVEAAYTVSPKVSGNVAYTKKSIDEVRAEDKVSLGPLPTDAFIVRAPYRNVQEESGNIHGDVKVIVSPKTNVTTAVDFYNATTLTSTVDPTLAPGRSTTLLVKAGHNFSDKMWSNVGVKTVRPESGEASNSAYVDITRQLTKNLNGKLAYLTDGVADQNILYGQLGYSFPIASTTGLYLKARRTTSHADGTRSDNAFLQLTHMVGNAQLSATYGKAPFDATYTSYGTPWDWMAGGSVKSVDTATIDFKITF